MLRLKLNHVSKRGHKNKIFSGGWHFTGNRIFMFNTLYQRTELIVHGRYYYSYKTHKGYPALLLYDMLFYSGLVHNAYHQLIMSMYIINRASMFCICDTKNILITIGRVSESYMFYFHITFCLLCRFWDHVNWSPVVLYTSHLRGMQPCINQQKEAQNMTFFSRYNKL